MLEKSDIEKLINDTHTAMEQTKSLLGKEIYQKRFKPVFEGYITALCAVLGEDEETTTDKIKGL